MIIMPIPVTKILIVTNNSIINMTSIYLWEVCEKQEFSCPFVYLYDSSLYPWIVGPVNAPSAMLYMCFWLANSIVNNLVFGPKIQDAEETNSNLKQ